MPDLEIDLPTSEKIESALPDPPMPSSKPKAKTARKPRKKKSNPASSQDQAAGVDTIQPQPEVNAAAAQMLTGLIYSGFIVLSTVMKKPVPQRALVTQTGDAVIAIMEKYGIGGLAGPEGVLLMCAVSIGAHYTMSPTLSDDELRDEIAAAAATA